MARRPVVDLGACTGCESCLVVAPEVFSWQPAGGYLEVAELPAYPEAAVDEAIRLCPARCLAWEDEGG